MKTPNINFLIPTKGEQISLLNQCINSINNFGQYSKYSYKISIYCQTEIQGLNVEWIKEEKQKGPLYGFNYLFRNTESEYIICLVEDHHFISSFDYAIDLLQNNYQMNKYKICSLSTNDGFPCGLPRRGQRLGSILNLQEDMPNCQICRFPVACRKSIEKYLNGYIFHPEFRYHAGDMWLGYYLYMMGEQCRECYESRLKQTIFTKEANFEVVDCNTFYALVKNFQVGHRDYIYEPNPDLMKHRYLLANV